jgi:protein TonB
LIDPDAPAARRAIVCGTVILLHGLALIALSATGGLRPVMRAVLPATLILPERRPPPVPPPLPAPAVSLAVQDISVPMPDIRIIEPAAPRAIIRSAKAPVPQGHFGATTDLGLGLDVAASSGGGTGSRGSLAAFEAAVRRQVLAGKRQPSLAWERRNTCVVNYTVHVAASGSLAGFSIAPCAIAEINEAARAAIRSAAPYPNPPDLGAASYEVHGSLVFRP